MTKLASFFKGEKYQTKYKPEVKRTIAVIIFTMIYGFGVSWFLEAASQPMYAGGVPGLAQLIRDILLYRAGIDWFANTSNSGLFLGIFTIVGNIPILLLGWFGVSKKFSIYSLLSIVLQATILGFIPILDLGLGTDQHLLINALIGGALIGIGVGGCLKYGASTGGLDIIGQYFALRKNQSVGAISMALNVTIAILGGIVVNNMPNSITGVPMVGGLIAAYTCVRIVTSSILTDKVHTGYQYLSVEIITSDHDPSSMVDAILTQMHRGVTLSKVKGAYDKTEKTLITCVISAYELNTISDIIKITDDKAFVIVKPVRRIFGNFRRKTIA
jgi:uncharacterized membrane-anchored protein YitT (DUF2179 family)